MARIELVTGEAVSVQGQDADKLALFLKTTQDRFVAIKENGETVWINPAHVVRITD